MKNEPLRNLIEMAYQVRDFQIAGGPDWMNSTQFDVNARRDSKPASQQEWFDSVSAMLQPLLHEKLHLRLHRESRLLPVYVLEVATHGPMLHRSREQACNEFVRSINPIPPEKRWAPDYCGAVETGPNKRLNHTLDAVGMKIAGGPDALTATLSRHLDRLVIDKTGLSGLFDIRLEWNREATLKSIHSGIYDAPAFENESPSLFTAVEEQLGLKLTPANAPVEVLVIDHAERPAAN
jgi:uncharacterized protein (TIGR03435 family)